MNLNDFDILLILLHANSARYCKLWAFLSRRFPTRMRSGCRGPGTWMFWRYLARPSWCLTVFDKRLLLDLCGKWAFLRCEPHMMWNDLNESLIKWVCYCLTWHVDRSRSQIVRLSAGCRHWFEQGSHEKRQGGSMMLPLDQKTIENMWPEPYICWWRLMLGFSDVLVSTRCFLIAF